MRIAARHVVEPVFNKPHRKTEFFRQVGNKNSVLDAAFHAIGAPDIDVVMHPHVVHRNTQCRGDLILILRHLD